MTELEAVNQMLTEGALLDAGVNSLETPEAQRAQQMLERVRKEELSNGHPFNTVLISLTYNTTGEVIVPREYLAVQLPCPYVVKNRRVFDPRTQVTRISKSFDNVKAALDIAIDQLPQIAANFIAWKATERFCASIRGRGSEQYAYCRDKARVAEVELGLAYPVKVVPQYGSDNVRRRGWSTRGRYSPTLPTGEGRLTWCCC